MPRWIHAARSPCSWWASRPCPANSVWACSPPWTSGSVHATSSPPWTSENQRNICIITWCSWAEPTPCSPTTPSHGCIRRAWACRARSTTLLSLLSSLRRAQARPSSTTTAPRRPLRSSPATDHTLPPGRVSKFLAVIIAAPRRQPLPSYLPPYPHRNLPNRHHEILPFGVQTTPPLTHGCSSGFNELTTPIG